MHKKGFIGVRSVVLSVMATCLLSLMVACGGGGDGGGPGASGSITLEADVTSIAADGKSSATITATITDSNGNPVPHYTDVTFTTNLGHFLNGGRTYTTETQPPVDEKGMPDTSADPTGKVVTALVAGTTAGTAQVTTTSNGVTQSIQIEISGGLPSSISLKASQGSVKSDNSDSTTITATVLDANNAALQETTVTFKATDGWLSAPSVVTDANGQAQVVFSCGNLKKSNRETTITANANTASKTMVVKITGTVLKPTTDYTNLEINPATRNFSSSQNKAALTIKAEDAGSDAISNELISVSVSASSTGNVSISPMSGYTDSNGEVQFEVTGEEQGEVTVNISGLGATATQKYTVGIAGEIFSITSPTSDPYSLRKGDSLTVVVRAPTQSQVIFATTCGAWDGGTQSVVTKAVANKQASAVLSSDDACTATVQVYDPQNPDTTDSLKVNIVLSSDEASQITLQANSYVVAPSTGEVSNTAALQARVRDDTYQIVPNVPVAFNISNSTGGGEYVTPPLAYTQTGTGIAEGIFTSGSMSSGAEGVTVSATVVGKESTVNDSINIVIGGTAGSIIIGRSSTIESVNNNTSYKLPMTAQVVDSNGNPVSGAKISLQLWPSQYATGIWVPQVITTEDANCDVEYSGQYTNEDDTFFDSRRRNLILDEGEDKNGDGQLTPASSAAGSIPAQVTADDTGAAAFYITYPKSSAAWIEAELTASTLVLGSEARSTTKFWLPWSQEDSGNCVLPDSPYNSSEAPMEIALTATPEEVVPDGGTSTSIIRALVTQIGEPVSDGTLVSFAIISGSGGLGTSTSSEASAPTTAGQASVLYYSGEIPGEVTIRARLADGTSSTVTLTLTKGVGDPYAITLTAEPEVLSADNGASQSVLRAYAEDSEGWPVFDGTLISFAILSGSGYFEGDTQEITDATVAGQASAVYYSGTTVGEVNIQAVAANGVSDETTITLEAVIGSMTLTASPATISADGSSSSSITAIVKDSSGDPVPKGTSVTFTTSLGTFQNKAQTYEVNTPNETGQVTVSLIAGNTSGVAVVTASAYIESDAVEVTQSTTVTFTSDLTLTLSADQLVIDANDSDEAKITATLEGPPGINVDGVAVAFSTDLGYFDENGQSTINEETVGVDGLAVVTLKSTSVGTATIKAQVTGAEDTIQISCTEP